MDQALGELGDRLVVDDKIAQDPVFEIVEIVEDGLGVAIALVGRGVADHSKFLKGWRGLSKRIAYELDRGKVGWEYRI